MDIEDTNKLNIDFLNEIKSSTFRNRLVRECKKLYKLYPTLTVINNKSNLIEILITETVDNIENNYGFILNNTYPFTVPKIYYNGEIYIELLRLKDKSEMDIVKKYKNKDCLCCDSYYCNGNWSPSLSMSDIIDEIKHIVKFKRDILNILFSNKLKKKYLIDDIDINSYLI